MTVLDITQYLQEWHANAVSPFIPTTRGTLWGSVDNRVTVLYQDDFPGT